MSMPPPPPSAPHPGFGHQGGHLPAPGYAPPAGPLPRPAGVIVIAILDILGGLASLAYALIMVVAGVQVSSSGEGQGMALFFVGFAAAMALAGVFTVITAVGLLTLKPWGRTCQMVLSVIGLLGIPIGTLINGVILYYLTRPGIKLLFSGRAADSFTHEERDLMARGSGQGAMIAVVIAVLLVGGTFVVGIIAAIAIPGLLRARMSGNEASAIGTLRAMNSGQVVWSSSQRGGYGTPQCLGAPASCGVDSPAPFISDDIASLANRSGYRFGFMLRMVQPIVDPQPVPPVESAEPGAPSDADVQRELENLASGDAPTPAPAAPASEPAPVAAGYVYWAVPETPGSTGTRAFCTDEGGSITEYVTVDNWTDPTEDDPKCPEGGRPLL